MTDEDTALPVTAALGLLANDADEDLNPIAATLVAGPTNGTVAFSADGSFVYTPNANFYGTDSFTYRAHDGALDSADASVTITVNPINDAPVGADSNVTALAAAYVFSVRDFGYGDVDGNPLDRLTITALPAVGQLLFDGVAVALNQEITAAAIAAGRLGYVPPTTGSAIATSFGFRVSDGLVYESGSHAMTIGFAAALATTPPPPPPAPDQITPPPAARSAGRPGRGRRPYGRFRRRGDRAFGRRSRWWRRCSRRADERRRRAARARSRIGDADAGRRGRRDHRPAGAVGRGGPDGLPVGRPADRSAGGRADDAARTAAATHRSAKSRPRWKPWRQWRRPKCAKSSTSCASRREKKSSSRRESPARCSW